jgi:LSD1 subclass zinc finger protein
LSVKVDCPACGRTLRFPEDAGQVRCDGCLEQFDLRSLRKASAPLWKIVIGSVLLVLGSVGILRSIRDATTTNFRNPDERMGFAGGLLVPIFVLGFGSTFFHGKVLVEKTGIIE